jgi:hypothetical protein
VGSESINSHFTIATKDTDSLILRILIINKVAKRKTKNYEIFVKRLSNNTKYVPHKPNYEIQRRLNAVCVRSDRGTHAMF